jgi:hypothetical protein
VNLPTGIGSGIPTPTSGLPDLNDPASITGAVAAAAFSGSTPSTTAVPDPTTFNAAFAAASAAITGSQLPANGPTTITINSGGLQVPIFNGSNPMPSCGSTDYGDIGIRTGNGTTDDKVVICENKPSLGGFAYYEIPTTNAVVSAVFSGNGTGLVCLPSDNWCEIDAYPNNTLFALRPKTKITPGSCTFCTLQWDAYGDIVQATSGNITLYNTTASYANVTTYYSNSMWVGDNETAIVNQGYTILNQALVQDLNVTDKFINTGSTTLNTLVVNGATTMSGDLNRPIVSATYTSPFSVKPNCTGAQLCDISAAANACTWGSVDPCQIQVNHNLLTTSSIARVSFTKGLQLGTASPFISDYSVGSLRIFLTCGSGTSACTGTSSGAMNLFLEIMRY